MATKHAGDGSLRRQLHVLVLMSATGLGLYLCYRMALPFVPALTWALALAVLFMPVHRWLKSTVKGSNLAGSVSVLVIVLIVIVPAAFMGQRLVSEAAAGADALKARVDSGEWQRLLDGHPRLAPFAQQKGSLGGLMFWWLGLPAPLLWGLVMAALAVVPVLGAFVVWVPAALVLTLEGSWVKALILALWGGVVVGGIDNVIYPITGWQPVEAPHDPRVHGHRRWLDCLRPVRPDSRTDGPDRYHRAVGDLDEPNA